MKKISCIIPAYNEEAGIGPTLDVVSKLVGRVLHEVIVVDDGSIDRTKNIAKNYLVTLIENETNIGKSKTVARGIEASSGDYIFLLDADLKNLSKENIIDLVTPIQDGTAEMSISYRKNAWPLFPFKKIDYLSGERILSKSLLFPALSEIKKLTSYGLEVFINRIVIKENMKIAVVPWLNVENVFNQDKRGWLSGTMVVIKIWLNVLSTVSLFEMYYQNIKMIRLINNK
jgi:glycosyltransferase involved in cell wall biosynthesis